MPLGIKLTKPTYRVAAALSHILQRPNVSRALVYGFLDGIDRVIYIHSCFEPSDKAVSVRLVLLVLSDVQDLQLRLLQGNIAQ